MMPTPDKRIKILSPTEIYTYFSQPKFTGTERSHYFAMSDNELQRCHSLAPKNRWYFILLLGYFKARNQFYKVNHQQARYDIRFICGAFKCNKPNTHVSDDTHRKIRHIILDVLEYSDNANDIRLAIQEKAEELAKTTNDPKTIFQALYNHTAKLQFVIPKYSTFQVIISEAIRSESVRLQGILKKHLPNYASKLLKKLLATDQTYYEITAIIKDQKNFKHDEVMKILSHKNHYNKLYVSSKRILPKLLLTPNMITYYGSLAVHYPVGKLRKLPKYTAFLYLLCYISNRIKKFNENLMSSFVFYIDRYEKSAIAQGKLCVYKEKISLNTKLKNDVPEVLRLFIEDDVDDPSVRSEGLKIMPKSEFQQVIEFISKGIVNENYFRWKHYEERQGEITKNLRPIFMGLEFKCSETRKPLSKAIDFMRENLNASKPLNKIKDNKFPINHVPDSVSEYIYCLNSESNTIKINHSQYEFCVYSEIKKQFRKNEITIMDSINHKKLEDDLIPRRKLKSTIKSIDSPLLSTPFNQALPEDDKILDELYHRVNKRIESGENKSVKIDQSGEKPRIILAYNNKEDLANHQFFEKIPKVSLTEILNFVHKKTRFLNRFNHVKQHHANSLKDKQCILGVLIANATHHGILSMANMSNLNYQSLLTTEQNFIRLNTLKSAGDCLSESIAKLNIFSDWNIAPNLVFAGVDGQKHQTRIDVLLARNSAKYFPLKKGIVAYTLLANFIPLSVETISPNMHESYFLFDIIKNLTADIKIDYISGDSHSINPVNFLVNRYLPVEFAPHLIHINSKIANLHSISHPNEYKDMLIKPHKRTRSNLIESEEENINWVIASLLRGETRQNIIVRKLSSLSKHHNTCKAMAEYNRVFESMYTLRYIDDPLIKQYVRSTLNRTEAYHQLRRAIAFANGGQLRGGSDLEVAIWNECARVIALAIIYYNACLLNALIKKYRKRGDHATVETIKRISPIAWTHILMLGKFEFSMTPVDIDIEDLIKDIDLF
jgi:TnpA family transposase